MVGAGGATARATTNATVAVAARPEEFSDVLIAVWQEAIAGERANELHFVLTLIGGALLVFGLCCSAVATWCHLAWALPLREVGRRPNFLPGFAGLLLGALALAGARWTAPSRPRGEGTRDLSRRR